MIPVWFLIVAVLAMLLFLALAVFSLKEAVRREVRREFDVSRSDLQEKTVGEFERQRQAVDQSVKTLKDELERYSKLVHELEKDRDKKYGNLENELKNASQATSRLQETTAHLTNVLGNVKKRGEWGERMAEDIVQLCGLKEGVNYAKQTRLASVSTQPDFTFFLPDKHKIHMDVKFPLDNYLNMVNAENPLQKENYKKDFINNVKARIKEIQGRSYIDPSQGTLDFVLVFIPNEQVYGFIQENFPSLMDESLKQKVVLCSPFTLYAMLRVIRQAFENFYYENSIKKIIETINVFAKEYNQFKERFQGLGDVIRKAGATYEDLHDKNFKRLDAQIKKIEGHKEGKLVALEEDKVIDIPS
ncbi:MAG TPA: DNA recombination protein RmuC [Candidatus Omnitrophota bacterium]|nr:DNA recombination protein RmuC [Candidatus Omnitrophota bacterium]HQL41184.1 DNA recombination protein RmuC [Candidatus Omnitrophota bacterium]